MSRTVTKPIHNIKNNKINTIFYLLYFNIIIKLVNSIIIIFGLHHKLVCYRVRSIRTGQVKCVFQNRLKAKGVFLPKKWDSNA